MASFVFVCYAISIIYSAIVNLFEISYTVRTQPLVITCDDILEIITMIYLLLNLMAQQAVTCAASYLTYCCTVSYSTFYVSDSVKLTHIGTTIDILLY